MTVTSTTHPLATGTPPAWASDWGEDRFGVFVGFRLGDVEQRLRWIPPGTFWMGTPESEEGRSDNETRHLVTLSRGFWLADTPCTQELWREVMGENPSRFVSERRPVEMVSWEDCQAFFERLEERVPGLGASLPTEAEWEYACRAGTESATWLGDLDIQGSDDAPILDSIAWYRGNSGEAGSRLVAEKPPNPWGLFDMLGNVWEWCQDWFNPYSIQPVVDPTVGRHESWQRVLRGGAWTADARRVRAAYRFAMRPVGRGRSVGFRIALTP